MYSPGDIIKTLHTGNAFLVQRVCEEGGMGVVYIGIRAKDQKYYALKTFREDKKKDDLTEAFRQFRWESLVWIILGKHRNIVQAYWFDLDEYYRPFLIVEYIEGKLEVGVSLRHWLRKKGKPELELALTFSIQSLTGLIYAKKVLVEELKIPFIHRDIKPDNMLITGDGLLKVTDFGLVKAFGFAGGGMGGTYPYMPPEQWRGEEVEEKTDVYALGCVLYEMIEGHGPFEIRGKNRKEIMEGFRHQHIHEIPKPLDDISLTLNDLIMQCLSKSPHERPDFWSLRERLQDIYSNIFTGRVIIADEAEPLTAEDLNARGSGFDQLRHHQKAIACYDAAVALDPGDLRLYLNRANARLSLKNFDEAWGDYKQALSLDPQAVEVHLGLGSLLAQRGENEKALEYYRQAEKVNPNEPMVYVGLGNLYAKNEKYAEAETAFLKALSLRAGTAEAHLGLGNVFVCRKDYKNAEICYKKAISLNPLYFQAYLNLARLYQLVGKLKERDKTIEKISDLMPLINGNQVHIG